MWILEFIKNNQRQKMNENEMLNDKPIFVAKSRTFHGLILVATDLVTLNENGEVDNEFLEEMDKKVSTRAINFCRNIKASKNITNSFKTIIQSYDEELKKDSFQNLDIFIDHIDGTMNAKTRLQKLSTLNNPKVNSCNILSNARCLSEGIDVPALDSVVFFDGRSAQVDIIQSVGRVMRKSTATQKEIGYIILPIALSENELKNLDSAVSNTNFQSIWKVLKALRSHDETLVDESVFREKIKIAVSDYVGGDSSANSDDDKPYEPRLFDSFTLSELANTMYNAMPTKLGDKGYWQSFSAKTAKIVEKLIARLNDIFALNPEILAEFLASLKENIHPNIKESEAVEMICSHIITKPIFDALFGDNINDNPIGKALDEVSVRLSKLGLDDEETHSLNALYKSVSDNAKLAKSEKSKQELIKNLYDTFFRSAFKKQAERLGIVYTPLEVVDFILHSTNALLKRHFGVDFDDSSVKVFDPFTGTGSFITRLLSKENALIADKNLKSKFTQGIFAQDIVLLAYYIALINITQTGQGRVPTLAKFSHIALCDSLDYLERVKKDSGLFALEFRDLETNKHIKDLIANENIKVIIGNPPYSGGASNANDNNANIPHPKLEQRVKETYGKESTANLAKNTRDTLIQAIRMSSDRLDRQGIIGFVVNGGFIDSSSADSFRKCVAKEFSEIYVLDLRGDLNAQMQGKKYGEGGNIFDKKVGVAIVFFVKDLNAKKECQIHYYDIGDYLSREAKLQKIEDFKTLENVPFVRIMPNQKGDWINQRGENFDKLLPLKSEKKQQGIFIINATGVATNREFWAYNFSTKTLKDSMQRCIDAYNEDLARFNKDKFIKKCKDKNLKKSDYYKELSDKDISTDTTKIAWSANLKNQFIRSEKLVDFDENKVRIASTSPFSKQYLYFDESWNESQSQFPKIFPKKESENVLILTSLMATKEFSAFIVNGLADLQTLSNTSVVPLYYYEDGQRECAISDFAVSECEKILGVSVEKEEIFYYIYALFHHKGFVEKYKFELCKEAPRVSISKDFKALSNLGRKLADLHLNYENGELYKEVEFQALADINDDEMYKVKQIIKSKDGATLHYNANINLKNIPPKAYSYKINGRSAIDIFIDRYQIKQDKASLISNNPNDFRGGKYIYELLCRLIVLALKSVDMIEDISRREFYDECK